MVRDNNNLLVLNDHVSLPIIISNWDVINDNKQMASRGVAGRIDREDSISTIQSTSSSTSLPKWTTEFGNFVEDMFGRMTDGMKRKLRDACVEVLRRTDEMRGDELHSPFDEDARLLD